MHIYKHFLSVPEIQMTSTSRKKKKSPKKMKASTLMRLPKYVFLAKLVLWEIVVYAKYDASKANGLARCAPLMKRV